MYQNILVTTDGSRFAERAFPHAVWVAKASAAPITLCRVLEPDELIDEADAQRQLQADITSFTSNGLQATAAIGRHRHPATAILDSVETTGSDLVVMATHGRSALGRITYGSVADEIMRRCSCPVMLVPPSAMPPNTLVGPLEMLVPLDGSADAERVLAPAVDLSRTMGVSLRLLRVISPHYWYGGPELGGGGPTSAEMLESIEQSARMEAEEYLTAVANPLRSQGMSVDITVMTGNPVLATSALSENRRCVAIAVATHARSGILRGLMGSVATGIVQGSAVPVVVVGPNAAGSKAETVDQEASTSGSSGSLSE